AIAQLLGVLPRCGHDSQPSSLGSLQPTRGSSLHGAASVLAQAYPGRFVLGIGGGYPQQATATGREFGSPLSKMRDYLDRMDGPTMPPAPDAPYPRIIAANGPKMLALAGELADGALPAGGPPAFTAQARQVLGPDKLLVVGLTMVPDSDPARARQGARERVSAGLAQPWFAAAVARLGFSEQEIAEVSDRLVDTMIAHGDPAAIAAKAGEHLAAGADHVALLPPIGTDFATGVDQAEWLAPALRDLH
ncbi:LLM class flavin-dependent oxidoreductase, partial [Nonomuraea fuscirosea]